jgi:hypothetical protein
MWDHLEGILKVLLDKAESGSQVSRETLKRNLLTLALQMVIFLV